MLRYSSSVRHSIAQYSTVRCIALKFTALHTHTCMPACMQNYIYIKVQCSELHANSSPEHCPCCTQMTKKLGNTAIMITATNLATTYYYFWSYAYFYHHCHCCHHNPLLLLVCSLLNMPPLTVQEPCASREGQPTPGHDFHRGPGVSAADHGRVRSLTSAPQGTAKAFFLL